MIKSIVPLLLCVSLLGCAANSSNLSNSRNDDKPTPTDLSYMGKAKVFPAELNGAAAFNSQANTDGQSETAKAVRYFLNSEQNKTNASITLYLLSTLGHGDTVAAQTESEVRHWAEAISEEGMSYRVKMPEAVYSSELGGVNFYFGELVQNHVTAYDLYMAEINDRLVQIRLVGPATRADRVARREIVSQIAKHLASI